MKVLIVCHGDRIEGGKTKIMMEALLAAGHEVVTQKLEDMPQGTYNVTLDPVFDECRQYQKGMVKAIIESIRKTEVIKIKHNPGPRDRWGKVK